MKKTKRVAKTNNKPKCKEGERIALPIHPGAILREKLLISHNISPLELAQALKVPKEQIQWVCEEKTNITPDLARRLSIYFDTSVELWLNLQKSYEEEMTELEFELLKEEITPYKKEKETISKREKKMTIQSLSHAQNNQ